MDVTLARTFLMVAETGSFIDAARKMNITQSTVSARIKGLEDLLGRPLFQRSKSGAELTAAGEQFQQHALALVRVWQHAQLEVGLSDQHRDHLAVGAPISFWDGFLLRWISWLRSNIPDIAVSASSGMSVELMQRLIEGTLDLAVMYRPTQPPGLTIEHLFDEEFVLVTSVPASQRRSRVRLCVHRLGAGFPAGPRRRLPRVHQPGPQSRSRSGRPRLSADQRVLGLFPLAPRQLVSSRADACDCPSGRASSSIPVYVVYPEARNEEAYEPILNGLRRLAAKYA